MVYCFMGDTKMSASRTVVGLRQSQGFSVDVHMVGDEHPPIRVNTIKVGEYGSFTDFISIHTATRRTAPQSGEYLCTDDVTLFLSVEQAIDLRNELNVAIERFA